MDLAFTVERVAWKEVRAAVRRAVREVKRFGRQCLYSDTLIVSMYLWTVKHSQSLSWACDRLHYNSLFRPRQLPSISQFTRRVGCEHTQDLLQRVHEILLGSPGLCDGGFFDGKPLPVSAVSKDPDARAGHITGGFARGYKLHAYVNRAGRIMVWSVMPLNVDERPVALELMPYVPELAPDAVNLADSNYDSAELYKAHEARGMALLTPLRGQKGRHGEPRHETNQRKMGPHRREAVEIWDHHAELADLVMKDRIAIERAFSVLTTAVDLRLPPSVRRLARVRRFTGAKIILYHARLNAQEKIAQQEERRQEKMAA